MKVSRDECENPSPDTMDRAAAHSGLEYEIRGDRLVFRICPLCDEDSGPRYASAYKASWFMGGSAPGGFRCVHCRTAGPYVIFRALGVEVEAPMSASRRIAERIQAKIRAKIGENARPEDGVAAVEMSAVETMHQRSIALLFDEEGSQVRDYLAARKIMPPEDYPTFPAELQTIGAWRYADGSYGVAWWYFDVEDKKPLLVKFRSAEERAKGAWRKLGKWPAGIEHVPCYREHLCDFSHDETLIVEGEADAESWALLRIPNVVSLPDGADSADATWDILGKAKTVYLSMDYDGPGSEGAHKIEKLLPKDATVFRVRLAREDGLVYKDANDALVAEDDGEDFLYDSYSQALMCGQPGLRLRRTYIPTGFSSWDEAYFGLRLGGYTHIFGGPGEGKTTFAWSVLLNMVNRQTKSAYISLEEPCGDICTDMAASVEGYSRADLVRMGLDESSSLAEAEAKVKKRSLIIEKVVGFYGCGAEWPDSVVPSYKRMKGVVETAAKRGAKLIVIDNYSVMRNALTTPAKGARGRAVTDYEAASMVAQEMLSIAKGTNTHVMLLNHLSGGGSAYGKARIDPLADMSLKCKRGRSGTSLDPSKVRLFAGDAPVVLKVRRAASGAFVDAGSYEKKGRGDEWEGKGRRGNGYKF